MQTKFEAHRVYNLVIDKMLKYEDLYNYLTGDELNHYEHLKSMSEYLADSLELGTTEVFLNMAEVSSLTRKIN